MPERFAESRTPVLHTACVQEADGILELLGDGTAKLMGPPHAILC